MLKQCFKINMLNQLALAFLGLSLIAHAQAGELKPFDAAAFKKAQAEQRTVVLDYHADWCPVCRKQKPALNHVLQSKEFEKVIGFEVNFDEQPGELKKLVTVGSQSTIVVFKGKDIKGQESGITDADAIKSLIKKGL